MATLYLHIGTPKTGTTAIQRFCRHNGPALAKRDFCFPNFPGNNIGQNGRFLLRSMQGTEEQYGRVANWRENMDLLIACFRDFSNVILSEEGLWYHSLYRYEELWEALKREAEANHFCVKIIAYLRRQDQFLISQWAHWIKNPHSEWGPTTLSFHEALPKLEQQLELDYAAHLEKLASVFGRENIIVRIYDRKRFQNGDILSDFLDAVGLSLDSDFVMPKGDQNESISGNALEIKRILNDMPEFQQNRELWLKSRQAAFECYKLERKRMEFSMFSEDELAAFLQKYEASNRLVARDYLGDENQPLFDPPGELPPKWEPDNPYLYEAIVTYFGFLAAQQQKRIEELTARAQRKNPLRRALVRIKRGVKGLLARPGQN